MRGIHRTIDFDCHKRSGAVVVLVAVSLVAIMGFAMLTVDVGILYNAKADLQRAADAAAMAAASAYMSEAGLSQDIDAVEVMARDRALVFGRLNPTLKKPTIVEDRDIELGRHDFDNPLAPISKSGDFNAVEVTVRRDSSGSNGPLPLFFAKVFGKRFAETSATARAVFSDQVGGYRLIRDSAILPFTLHEELYNIMVQNGPDEYAYDGSVLRSQDGVREVVLFPWRTDIADDQLAAAESSTELEEGAGNFGTLNIGVTSESASVLEDQIRNGADADELEREFGISELDFVDDDGNAVTYPVSGNPGLSAGMKGAVEARIGDIVGFFLHRSFGDNGSNALFEIVAVRYGRIVAVNLTGAQAKRSLVIQPISFTDEGVIIDDDAPSTGGQLGRILLVK